MSIEAGTTYHICIDISGALKKSDHWLEGILNDKETGREMTAQEVREFLINQQEEHGREHYSGCDNMQPNGRCGGHRTETA